MIPYGRQDITQEDINSVVDVLKSDFITQGPVIPQFEKAVADKVQAKNAIAVNSGTSALHIACLALGLGPGDWLWTTPITFVASANCGLYCGAKVDFVDIDPDTWNMSTSKLKEKLRKAKRENSLPKVIVPVHFAGQPTEQEKIYELAKEYGFRVIEDASHAIGAKHNGEPVGSCKWSDITVFSFHPVKIITTAEGGMTLTNNKELAGRLELYRSHGITKNPEKWIYDSPGSWYYEMQKLGYNYRMTDIQAALGLSQLNRLDKYVTRRNNLANRYTKALEEMPLESQKVYSWNQSSYHLYVVKLKKDNIKKTRSVIFNDLRKLGVGVNVHYMPVHLQPYYRELGFHEGLFPESECYSKEAITLPLYPKMTEEEQDIVISALKNVF